MVLGPLAGRADDLYRTGSCPAFSNGSMSLWNKFKKNAIELLPLTSGYPHCVCRSPKSAQILFWQSPHFISYMNGNQVFLSGCCYRSIDLTAIDSTNEELGAQHNGVWLQECVYKNIFGLREQWKKRKQKQVVRTPRRDRNLYIIWKAHHWLCRWNA